MSWIIPSLNPDREKRLVSSQHLQTGFGDHPASYSVGTGANRPGCKAEQSSPSSAGVRNEWSRTYIRYICLDVLYKDKRAFPLLCRSHVICQLVLELSYSINTNQMLKITALKHNFVLLVNPFKLFRRQ
jgi:hypothetical protein